MLILEKSLLDCEIFMTKNSFLPVLSSALCLTLNFLGLFFSRISCVCGLRRVRSFCMCFVNVLGLDCSWFLKINFDVSGLRTPVSWAVSQMKGNSLKSVKFFLLVNFRITSISELISFVCDCCRQGQCLLVCLSSMETVIKPATKPHLGCAAVLGLLPVEPQCGLGWREPWRWPSSSPAPVGSLSVSQDMALCSAAASSAPLCGWETLRGDVYSAQGWRWTQRFIFCS